MPNFPLSPCRQIGNIFFVSGQIGQQNGELVSQDITEQANQALANAQDILHQNGLSLQNVVDVTAFLTEQTDYDAFNGAYRNYFTEPFPSRTTVTVKSLPLGARIELKIIAAKQ